MKKHVISAGLLSLSLVASIFAHDLFLKTDSYFLKPNSNFTVKVMNGTFLESEGAVAFARLNDVSVVSGGNRVHPKETDLSKDETTAFLNLTTGRAGTYVVGLSTKSREIALKAADFNEYLREDGLPDTLEERRKTGELEKDLKSVTPSMSKRFCRSAKVRLMITKLFLVIPSNSSRSRILTNLKRVTRLRSCA